MKEKLLEARALVESSWCQNAYARTAEGYRLPSPLNPQAFQFCALGALYRVLELKPGEDSELLDRLQESSQVLFGREVADVNDNLGLADVLAIYDHALETL